MPTVAVVFVATDECELLAEALASLLAPSQRPQPVLEVVVVDNASRDGTGDEVAARWPKVRVIRQSRRCGLSTNVNAGIRATRAPFVMVCNSDIVFRSGACARLAAFLEAHPRAGIVAPRLVGPAGEAWPVARRWYTPASLLLRRLPFPGAQHAGAVRRHLYDDWGGVDPQRVDWVMCAAAMMRRKALGDIGLMDERFRIYFDDVDLALRAHQAGWEVWAVPDAVVVHHWQRASRRPLTAAWFSHLASLARFIRKHGGLRPRWEGTLVPGPVGCDRRVASATPRAPQPCRDVVETDRPGKASHEERYATPDTDELPPE